MNPRIAPCIHARRSMRLIRKNTPMNTEIALMIWVKGRIAPSDMPATWTKKAKIKIAAKVIASANRVPFKCAIRTVCEFSPSFISNNIRPWGETFPHPTKNPNRGFWNFKSRHAGTTETFVRLPDVVENCTLPSTNANKV